MSNQTIRTPEKRELILQAIRERPSFSAACRKARISRTVFYDWRRDDPEFDAALLKAREEGLDALEDALVARGLKSDTTAAIFLLKSHRRDVYGDRVETTHRGTITHKHIDLSVYSTDEKLMLDELLAKQDQPHVSAEC